MRANECLVPVDPVTQTRKMKKLATDIRQAPALSRPGRDTSVYPLTLLIMNVPEFRWGTGAALLGSLILSRVPGRGFHLIHLGDVTL